MNRALVAVCLLVSLADAAPKYDRPAIPTTDPDLVAAETAWSAAAAEKDPAKRAASWEAAAAGFLKVVDAGVVPTPVQKDAAYAAILAWKNALDVDPRLARSTAIADFDKVPAPQPLEPRDQALIHAIDVYLTFSPPPDEASSVKFLRANVLRRRHQYDKALAGFLDILEHHRDQEVAEYAANLVLDTYNLLQRYDAMISFAAKLRADRTFLANKPDLAAVVARIHAVALRKEVEGIERDARTTRDRAAYEKCGEAYLALVAEPGLAPSDAEELRYNAGVCFEEAGSIDRAVATYRQLIKTHPRSRLAGRAVARIARAEAQVAHYREAAEALEQYVERYPGEKDAVDAASDGVLYAVVTGDLSRAARIADLAIARYGAKKPRLTVEATLVVIEAQLAAGKRKEALARARGAATKAVLRRLGDPVFSFRAGRAFAATGCPVALVDELCPKPRDRALVAASRLQLALAGDRAAPRAAHHVSSAETTPIADHATRLALDLDLEPVLAARRSIAPATDAVARGYEQLIVAARAADVRIAAHARLGTLHRHKGDRDKALLALRACVTEARASSTGSEWLVRCERDLIALRAPDLDILPERLPAPAATPEILVERIR